MSYMAGHTHRRGDVNKQCVAKVLALYNGAAAKINTKRDTIMKRNKICMNFILQIKSWDGSSCKSFLILKFPH